MSKEYSFIRGIPSLNLERPVDLFVRFSTNDKHELVNQVVFQTLDWIYIAAEFYDDKEADIYLDNLAKKFIADYIAKYGMCSED